MMRAAAQENIRLEALTHHAQSTLLPPPSKPQPDSQPDTGDFHVRLQRYNDIFNLPPPAAPWTPYPWPDYRPPHLGTYPGTHTGAQPHPGYPSLPAPLHP